MSTNIFLDLHRQHLRLTEIHKVSTMAFFYICHPESITSASPCYLLMSVEKLFTPPEGVSARERKRYAQTLNCLLRGTSKSKELCGPVKIQYLFQILLWSEKELLQIYGFAKDSLILLTKVLANHKLSVGFLIHMREFLPSKTA